MTTPLQWIHIHDKLGENATLLVLVDQHAADERIRLERYLQGMNVRSCMATVYLEIYVLCILYVFFGTYVLHVVKIKYKLIVWLQPFLRYSFEYVQKLRKLTHVGQVCHANNVASAHEDFHPQISLISQIEAKYRVVGIK